MSVLCTSLPNNVSLHIYGFGSKDCVYCFTSLETDGDKCGVRLSSAAVCEGLFCGGGSLQIEFPDGGTVARQLGIWGAPEFIEEFNPL